MLPTYEENKHFNLIILYGFYKVYKKLTKK